MAGAGDTGVALFVEDWIWIPDRRASGIATGAANATDRQKIGIRLSEEAGNRGRYDTGAAVRAERSLKENVLVIHVQGEVGHSAHRNTDRILPGRSWKNYANAAAASAVVVIAGTGPRAARPSDLPLPHSVRVEAEDTSAGAKKIGIRGRIRDRGV